MACTHDQAVSELVARVAPILAGQGIEIKYPNGPDINARAPLWARLTVRYENSQRATLGVRRERHVGKLFLQYMFAPGGGSTDLYSIPQLALDALVDYKSPSGVWLRQVVLREGYDEIEYDNDAYFCMTIRAHFEHDEIRTS